MIFERCQNGSFGTTLCFIEAGSALDCSEKMSCDSFGNLILRSNVVPNAQLVTFDRLGLNSVLFLANFLTYTKVRFIANFFQWNTLENLLFPFQVAWKKASKDWWTKSNCIPNDRMYAYRLCNMQYISVSVMHLL